MAEEAFYERFRRVVFAELRLSAEAAAVAMGCSADAVRRLADGRTAQAKFDEALRLCERYNVDPWMLAFGRARATPQESDAETEARSPEDPVWEAIRLLREDVLDLKEAIESPGGAAESKPSKRHRGRRSA